MMYSAYPLYGYSEGRGKEKKVTERINKEQKEIQSCSNEHTFADAQITHINVHPSRKNKGIYLFLFPFFFFPPIFFILFSYLFFLGGTKKVYKRKASIEDNQL
jgi:hypothetical protein